MIELDASTVLLQWAAGGLIFLWVTTRRCQVSIGYGWLLRIVYGLLAIGSSVVGFQNETVIAREIISIGIALSAGNALFISFVKRKDVDKPFNPNLDLVTLFLAIIGLVIAGLSAGGPMTLALLRTLVGALFLGVVSDAMLLGHWYLVQPGLNRAPLIELVKFTAFIWPFELIALLIPTGMISVINGTIDDGYDGLLGWFWIACTVSTIVLIFITRLALREKQYSAVMAATGLLYLAILTAFGMDLVARATLA